MRVWLTTNDGAVPADLLLEALRLTAHLPDRAVEVERRRRRASGVRDQAIEAARRAQPPDEAALDEAIGGLDRRRIGERHQDGDVGGQPEIERQGRVRRAEIDDHVVDLERGDRRQRRLGRLLRPRRAEGAAFAADEAHAGDRRVDDELAEARRPCRAGTRRSRAGAGRRRAAGAAGRPPGSASSATTFFPACAR